MSAIIHHKSGGEGDVMKIACFTMFRNEAAILPPFLDQIEAFFDYTVLLNHESSDDGPAYVRTRSGAKIELFHLKAPGYPQSAVATQFAHLIMNRQEPDFLFLLDCDEFLPFSNRSELEGFLSGKEKMFDTLLFRWINICPTNLDGGNIFVTPFLHAPGFSPQLRKIVVTRRLAGRSDWSVAQGYHSACSSSDMPILISGQDDNYIYHIPVTSRLQFYFKIAVGATTLRKEESNLLRNQGWHWIDLEQDLTARQLSSERLTRIALHYPFKPPEEPESLRNLEFSFPYIDSPYSETAESRSGQIRTLIQLFGRPDTSQDSSSFTVFDEDGSILFSSGGQITKSRTKMPSVPLPGNLLSGNFAENYAALIEPLFCLPAKLPSTGWAGHIPFLFVLFRALRPETYVELGVQNGASLIAAASAVATYQLRSTALVGIDSWKGDEHAGYYNGDSLHRDLSKYFACTFPYVRLELAFFSEALTRFATGSVDILHIDGLHTYDAVRGDFTSWFDRVSSNGIILLHDIAVEDRGFGVYRLWNELKEHFTTLEFRHSFGLGVVILNPEDERLRPLVALARDQDAMRAYASLVADVARVLPERMAAYTEPPEATSPYVEHPEATSPYVEEKAAPHTLLDHFPFPLITALFRRHPSFPRRILAPFPRLRKILRL